MRNSYGWVGAAALGLLVSAIGCSDDSKGGGDGDGDGDRTGTGGFVISSTGGRSGDGDVADPCFAELVYCSSGCVDLLEDEDNCGSCGTRCDPGEVCEDGTCEIEVSLGGASAGGVGGGAGSPSGAPR